MEISKEGNYSSAPLLLVCSSIILFAKAIRELFPKYSQKHDDVENWIIIMLPLLAYQSSQ